MSTKVRFPIGYREGEQITTPHGTVTVGPNRETELTDKQAAHFDEVSEGLFDDVTDALTDEEATKDALLNQAAEATAATTAYQVPAIPPHKEYEDAATAREVLGKATRAAHTEVEAAVQAAAQKSAEERPNPDSPIEQTGLATVEYGKPVHAQSAALKVQAMRAKGRKVWGQTGDPAILEKRTDQIDADTSAKLNDSATVDTSSTDYAGAGGTTAGS